MYPCGFGSWLLPFAAVYLAPPGSFIIYLFWILFLGFVVVVSLLLLFLFLGIGVTLFLLLCLLLLLLMLFDLDTVVVCCSIYIVIVEFVTFCCYSILLLTLLLLIPRTWPVVFPWWIVTLLTPALFSPFIFYFIDLYPGPCDATFRHYAFVIILLVDNVGVLLLLRTIGCPCCGFGVVFHCCLSHLLHSVTQADLCCSLLLLCWFCLLGGIDALRCCCVLLLLLLCRWCFGITFYICYVCCCCSTFVLLLLCIPFVFYCWVLLWHCVVVLLLLYVLMFVIWWCHLFGLCGLQWL